MIRSMEDEVGGRRKSRKRVNTNEYGILPVNQGSLKNVFGGLDYGGMDSGMMDMNPLSNFGETCVDCNDDQQQKLKGKKEIFRKKLHAHEGGYSEGFDVSQLGGAFNGRFGQIGSGFIENVDSGRGISIDYDKGAKSSDAVSPVFRVSDGAVPSVFRSGEGFGLKKGKLERVAEKEGRQIARRRAKKEKEEMKIKKTKKKTTKYVSDESGSVRDTDMRETRFQRLKRQYKERQNERREEKLRTTGFKSTSVPLGHGAGSSDFETQREG